MSGIRLQIVLAFSISSALFYAAGAANVTGSEGAVLTDVHNRVAKRTYLDWSRKVWGDPSPGRLGDLLAEGTQVGTGEKSWAQISWPKVTTRIWEETAVAIAPNKRVVYLLDGEMLFNWSKDHNLGEVFDVDTKLLNARVRGTTFIVQSTAEFSRVAVLEGSLDVRNKLDSSLVHLGPGLVYEVRVGAPPTATWLRQNQPRFDDPGASSLRPMSFENPYASGNYQAQTPPAGTNAVRKRYSDAEIEAKAEELSRGDSRKKQYLIQELQKKNPDMPAQGYQSGGYQPKFQQFKASGGKYSNAEIEAKAAELSRGDPQKKQFYLQKLHELNGDPPQNYSNDNGVRSYQSSASTAASAPFVDTREFAPIPRKAGASYKNTKKENWPAPQKRKAYIQDLCSRAVAPISLFRTEDSATNLYVADQGELWRHRLVQGFADKLASLALVQEKLSGLPAICKMKSPPDNTQEPLSKRNELLFAQAKVVKGPAGVTFQKGREMKADLQFPGN